jgi:hypothetical protein
MDLLFVRPSKLVTVTGELKRAQNLCVSFDLPAYLQFAAAFDDNPQELYQDIQHNQQSSLEEVLGQLPMFVNELGLIAQVVADYENILEISPIVHCELTGRGIEYANGRATWDFRNKCEGKLADLESLCRSAYSKRNIPQLLMAKYERRCRDYMRSYRMGADSNDLEKLRAVIKSHRNMLDSYESFIKSDGVDDETDRHVLDRTSILSAVNKAMGITNTDYAEGQLEMHGVATQSKPEIVHSAASHIDVTGTGAAEGGAVIIPCVYDDVSDAELQLALEYKTEQLHEQDFCGMHGADF